MPFLDLRAGYLDTLEVLEAAGSKWRNFLPFRPGLPALPPRPGGRALHRRRPNPFHAQGLTHQASAIGYHPEVILAGRRINDRMGAHVAETVVKLMLQSGIGVCHSRVLVLGLAFKENCPDLRNSRVVDIIDALREYNITVDVYDPGVDRAEAQHEYRLDCLAALPAVAPSLPCPPPPGGGKKRPNRAMPLSQGGGGKMPPSRVPTAPITPSSSPSPIGLRRDGALRPARPGQGQEHPL